MVNPLVEAVTPQNATEIPWLVTLPHANDTYAMRHTIAHAWVNSPQVRGTMDILQSCLLTLVACVYTALHLNVPAFSSWYSVSWKKFTWVIMALFAPEIVVFMAASQLRDAWRLKKELRKLQMSPGTDYKAKNFNFDLTYAFFVVMGGVRVDIADMLSLEDLSSLTSEPFLRMPHPLSARLSPEGVIKLAKRGHWINIPRSKIRDKSKANSIQKALVFIQVSWMVGQCIARKINHLPLTILEVHTMVHVVCAIFLYVCWLKKPLDVQDPEILSAEGFKGEVAAMVQEYFYANWSSHLAIVPPLDANPPSHVRWRNPEPGEILQRGETLTCGLSLCGEADSLLTPPTLTVTTKFITRWELIFSTFDFSDRIALAAKESYVPETTPATIFPTAAGGYTQLGADNSGTLFLNTLAEFRSDAHPFKTDRENFDRESFGASYALLLFVLPGLYGGVHLAAWNWSFPTLLENLLWKVSCILIASFFPVALTIWGVLHLARMRSEAVLWFLAFLGAMVYLSARLYIIVESFLSLRHVPVGVYVSLEWFEIFPHF